MEISFNQDCVLKREKFSSSALTTVLEHKYTEWPPNVTFLFKALLLQLFHWLERSKWLNK